MPRRPADWVLVVAVFLCALGELLVVLIRWRGPVWFLVLLTFGLSVLASGTGCLMIEGYRRRSRRR